MATFLQWFVNITLEKKRWPKEKGLLRKTEYVPSQEFDLALLMGTQFCMGIGAGKPKLGAQIIGDSLENIGWTVESTKSFLELFSRTEQTIINRHDELPWEALVNQQLNPSNKKSTSNFI